MEGQLCSVWQRQSGQRRVRVGAGFPRSGGRAGRGARLVQLSPEQQLVPFHFRVVSDPVRPIFFSILSLEDSCLQDRNPSVGQTLRVPHSSGFAGGAARPQPSSVPPSRTAPRPLQPWVSSDFFVFANLHFI